MLEKANSHVALQRSRTGGLFRPRYHLSAPAGWINDPNGFCRFDGAYQLYCQFNPYDSVWGPMHWGHWTSPDLLNWTWRGVVMAPEAPFDRNGCFSGSAVAVGDGLLFMYTGVHADADGVCRQEQCIAESDDGQRLRKWDCSPVIAEKDLPEGFDVRDFRDPKLWRTEDGEYRCVVAARHVTRGGCVLCYGSRDGRAWRLLGIAAEGLGRMTECPDFETAPGGAFLIASMIDPPGPADRWQSPESSVAFAPVTVPDGVPSARAEDFRAFDRGCDFYAPQCAGAGDGRLIMFAWMLKPGEIAPTHALGHGWAGQYIFPRELRMRDGRLLQRPAAEIERLRVSRFACGAAAIAGHTRVEGLRGRHFDLTAELEAEEGGFVELRLMERGDEWFSIRFDRAAGRVLCDRSRLPYAVAQESGRAPVTVCSAPYAGTDGRVRLRVLADTSSVEVFFGDGELTMTMLAFADPAADGISLDGRGRLLSLEKWDLAAAVLD